MTVYDRNDPYQSAMFERKILKPYQEEYYRKSIYAKFIGKEKNPIVMKRANKGDGDNAIFNIRQVYFPNVKYGNERLQGTGEAISYAQDKIKISQGRFSAMLIGKTMQEIMIDQQFIQELHNNLLDQAELWLSHRFTTAFALSFLNTSVFLNDANYFFQRELFNKDFFIGKMLECGLDVANASGEAISRQRVVFGNDKGLAVATVGDALADAVLDDAVADTMTTKHILKLKQLASVGSRGNIVYKEPPIGPFRDETKLGFRANQYILFISNACYDKLLEDEIWIKQVERGVIASVNQPEIELGSEYVGQVHGVKVFVVPEFDDYVFENAGGTKYGYSVLLGGDAMAYMVAETPKLTPAMDDFGNIYEVAHAEISGMKILKFASKSNPDLKGVNTLKVENGLIHSFVRLH